MKQCIQFYYLWKKVCPEDYKQFQFQRRKTRNEDAMINTKLDIPVGALCVSIFDSIPMESLYSHLNKNTHILVLNFFWFFFFLFIFASLG